MRKVWLILIVVIFIPALACLADGTTSEEAAWQEINDFAMSTYLRISIPSRLENSQVMEIRGKLAEMDALFNRFLASSDLFNINEQTGKWVTVNEATFNLLRDSVRIAERTDGNFDPTVGPLTDLWGFRLTSEDQIDSQWAPPTPEKIQEKLNLVDYSGLTISTRENKVRLEKEGMSLDLGGAAKGYAVDRLAELLRSYGITSAIIDLGGNFYALGRHPEGRPWVLGIRHPRKPEQTIATILVNNQAVATSGDYQKYRMHNGQRFAHLLNPHTGWPAQSLASVTIIAPSGLAADALSTAVFILGQEQGSALIEDWAGVEGVIIGSDLSIWYSTGLENKIELP